MCPEKKDLLIFFSICLLGSKVIITGSSLLSLTVWFKEEIYYCTLSNVFLVPNLSFKLSSLPNAS